MSCRFNGFSQFGNVVYRLYQSFFFKFFRDLHLVVIYMFMELRLSWDSNDRNPKF